MGAGVRAVRQAPGCPADAMVTHLLAMQYARNVCNDDLGGGGRRGKFRESNVVVTFWGARRFAREVKRSLVPPLPASSCACPSLVLCRSRPPPTLSAASPCLTLLMPAIVPCLSLSNATCPILIPSLSSPCPVLFSALSRLCPVLVQFT